MRTNPSTAGLWHPTLSAKSAERMEHPFVVQRRNYEKDKVGPLAASALLSFSIFFGAVTRSQAWHPILVSSPSPIF